MKEKKYLIDNKKLMKEWNWEKNKDLVPAFLTSSSHKKAWWLCEKSHEWESTISKRNIGRGCPYCSNSKVLTGYNDLATTHPDLAKQWHPYKNGKTKPTDVFGGSGKKIWWVCDKGHEWEATPNKRSVGQGCPFCAGVSILLGYNDLASKNPKLASEWHPTKNAGLTPEQITCGSGKKIWWLCDKGHEWQSQIASRHSGGHSCPICKGRLLQGFTDLSTTHQKLANEWHPTKNNCLLPTKINAGSKKKVWWMCEKGHEWQATINSRSYGMGCPQCSAETKTSFPEQAVYFYLNRIAPCESRAKVYGKEADIFIPSLNVAIEYDGMFFHRTRESEDEKKNKHFIEHGIKIYRIKECETDNVDESKGIIYCDFNRNYLFLERAIMILVKWIFDKNIKIDIQNDTSIILAQYIELEKQNSIAIKSPELVASWNVDKNGSLLPEYISYSSSRKVWWKCVHGHEWQASPNNRSKGNGCPYCSNQKVLKGYNDLATINPKLKMEWHPTKNIDLSSTQVTSNSGKKVWWICKKNHEWEARIADRNKGKGCPICYKEKSKR